MSKKFGRRIRKKLSKIIGEAFEWTVLGLFAVVAILAGGFLMASAFGIGIKTLVVIVALVVAVVIISQFFD